MAAFAASLAPAANAPRFPSFLDRVVNEAGEIALLATFADQTQASVRVDVPCGAFPRAASARPWLTACIPAGVALEKKPSTPTPSL